MDGKVLPRYQRILEKKGNRTKFAGSNPMQEQVVAWEEELKPGERIEYSVRYKGLALVEADGTWIPFEGLSDGYRDVIKIVADIPSWQRRIVNALINIFPKIQFICASHSPFIVQSLQNGQLISMEGEVEEEYSGQSIEDIAEDIIGVENPQYSDEKQKMML